MTEIFVDEDLENERWLETTQENFEEAMADEDYHQARLIIADMKDAGFTSQARILEREIMWRQNKQMVV